MSQAQIPIAVKSLVMRDVVPLYEHPYLDSSVNVETCFLFINDAYCIIYFE